MSSIKEKVKDYKKEIKIGVITSIITSFIIYTIKSICTFLTTTGGKLINVFTDFIYYEMGRMNDLTFINFFGCFAVGMSIALVTLLILYIIFRKQIKRLEDLIDIQNGNNQKSHYLIKNIEKALLVTMLIIITVFPLGIAYCSDCKHEFDLDMTAMKPYISEKEYDMLYSEWVTMMGKKDYLKIKEEILQLRCKYIIKNESIKKTVCK